MSSLVKTVTNFKQSPNATGDASGYPTAYPLDREEAWRLLNEALATEIVCQLRYRANYYAAQGIRAEVAAEEFLEHANQEQQHMEKIAERIDQLGGDPDFSPDGLENRSHVKYVEMDTLEGMLRENLRAERVAVETYRQMIAFFGDKDPTTRRLLEEILEVEEEHAEDIFSLAQSFEKEK